jgi:predicted nucleic acid-binding protein
MNEFLAGKNAKQYNSVFQNCFIPLKVTLAEELLPYFNFDSTSGEIWVISYALKNPSCFCVIDEEFGRSICELFSINVTGAIGIINEMKKVGILSSNDLHCIRDKIRRSRFYLSKKLADELDRICLS